MFSFVKSLLFGPPEPLGEEEKLPANKGDLTADSNRFTKCTFCSGTSFYDGPSGGASQNIECSDCGARFNIHLIPGGPFLDMVIRQPTKEKSNG